LKSNRKEHAKMKVLLLLILFASVNPSAHAGPLGHVWHYVRTHKELLAYDAVVIAGPMADAASTVHCMHYSPYCTEDNADLPLRPTNAQAYAYAGGISIGLITVGHLVWHFAPHPADRQILIFIATPVAISDVIQTKANVDALSLLKPKE